MPIDKNNFFFSQYGKTISEAKSMIPFKNQHQFPYLVDTLCRKNSHHLLLQTDFSADLVIFFLQGLLDYCNHTTLPLSMHNAEYILLDFKQIRIQKQQRESIQKDFLNMISYLNTAHHPIIFSLIHFDLFNDKDSHNHFLRYEFKSLFSHANARFIVFTKNISIYSSNEIDKQFTKVTINKPATEDINTILQLQRSHLEHYHQVIIPDEILNHALTLGRLYFSWDELINKTVNLLDSSAARTLVAPHSTDKPIVSLFTLLNVLSNETGIPARNLQLNKFSYSEFIHEMEKKIFSQDNALTLLAHHLQQLQFSSQATQKLFCKLLLVGPEHSGKKTMAIALTDYLFNQPNLLYIVLPNKIRATSILDLKLQAYRGQTCMTFKELLKQIPYAVILYEDIHLAPPVMLEELQEIFTTGCLTDYEGKQHYFYQTSILLSTSLASELLSDIAKSIIPDESDEMNLFQLVMLEKPEETATPHYSAKEIAEKTVSALASHLPASLLKMATVLPFLPLPMSIKEKIIHLKLKKLSHVLKTQHGIDLNYANNVVTHLASNEEGHDMDILLHPFYLAAEQVILNQDNQHRDRDQDQHQGQDNQKPPYASRLFFQVNEFGQLVNV